MAKEVVGVVVRRSADGRTVYVVQSVRLPHPLYKKIVAGRRIYCVETYGKPCAIGDVVAIVTIKPMSKTKRWGLKLSQHLRQGSDV